MSDVPRRGSFSEQYRYDSVHPCVRIFPFGAVGESVFTPAVETKTFLSVTFLFLRSKHTHSVDLVDSGRKLIVVADVAVLGARVLVALR